MVDLSGQTVVAILTRAPGSGGKTRLFRALGCEPDPDLLRALFLDTLDAAEVPRTLRVVCFTPADAYDEMRALVPGGVRLHPQTSGDLGERMRATFDDLFEQGAAAVIVIGSDLPLLPRAAIARARDLLSARPDCVVLGPAVDGGYYLVGATRTPAPLLDVGGWGRPDVLERTLARARTAGVDVALVPSARDVDTLDDLRVVRDAAEGGVRTRAWAERALNKA